MSDNNLNGRKQNTQPRRLPPEDMRRIPQPQQNSVQYGRSNANAARPGGEMRRTPSPSNNPNPPRTMGNTGNTGNMGNMGNMGKTGNGMQNPSRKAPSQSVPRPSVPNPNARRNPTPAKTELSVSAKRNLLLAAIFSLLVVISIIVFSVQSCSSNKNKDYVPKDKNTVKLTADTTSPDKNATTAPAFAEYTNNTKTLTIESDYGILIDLSTNKVIASKNGEDKIYPASMTKMMTLIVAYENAGSLDRTFTFTSQLLDPLYAANASQAGFAPGETVTVKDMLYGCALPSGGDATVGLASLIAGSEPAFAEMMNQKAKEMGLKNTHFVTVSGLHDDNHYSTCHEMAIILEYAINIPLLREIMGTYKYTTSPTEQHPDGINLTSTMYNRMVGDEAPGVFVQGGKTGYTNEALNCLASFAARCTEDMAPQVKPEYILVTAHASGEYTPVFDAISVYKAFCSDSDTTADTAASN